MGICLSLFEILHNKSSNLLIHFDKGDREREKYEKMVE